MHSWAACYCSVTDQKQSCDCRLIGGLCLKFQRVNYVANFLRCEIVESGFSCRRGERDW